jgi:ParB family chromosome partitioning protein
MPVGRGIPLAETTAARALAQMHDAWAAGLPGKASALWDWLLDCDADTRASLLAYCVARTLNAIHQPYDRRPSALAHATQVANALALDLSAQWSPTVSNYLGRVTRAQILGAVREAKGEAAAQMIDHLKKDDMAAEAERLLEGTGWLPALLRTPGGADEATAGGPASWPFGSDPDLGCADDTLPAFLDREIDDEGATSDEPPYAIAAE